MITARMDKHRAIGITRIAQVGFAVLAGAAAVVAYQGLPSSSPASPADYTPPAPNPLPQTKGGRTIDWDVRGSAARISKIANAPKAAAIAPVTTDKPAPAAAPAAAAGDIKYLGLANMGGMRMALLSITNKQRFVRVGSMVGAEEVTQIEPDAVTLHGSGHDRRIELQARGAERITRLRPSAPGPAAQPPVAPVAKAEPYKPPPGVRYLPDEKGGVMGLSAAPEGFEKWSPPYRRRFERAMNRLREQGPFPDDESLIGKTQSLLESEGITNDMSPEEIDKVERLEQMESGSGEKPKS